MQIEKLVDLETPSKNQQSKRIALRRNFTRFIFSVFRIRGKAKARILVLEDGTSTAGECKFFLEERGFSCDVTSVPLVAFKLLKKRGPYDLLLLNADLPRTEKDLTSQLRELDPVVPIIAVGTEGKREDLLRYFSLGVVDFIEKPYLGSRLLKAIQRVETLHHYRGQHSRQIKELESMLEQCSHFLTLGQMAGSIIHDIKNPLLIASYHLNRLQEGKDNLPSLLQESVEKLALSLNQMIQVTQSTLSISKNPVGETRAMAVPVLPSVQGSLASLEIKLKKASILITLDIHPSLNVVVEKNHLERVLVNLISNSIDALEQRQDPKIQISAHSLEDGRWAQINVHDNGPGLPKSINQNIFERPFTTKGDADGTGLGLYLANRLIKQNCGTMAYQRTPAGETVFSIRLPTS